MIKDTKIEGEEVEIPLKEKLSMKEITSKAMKTDKEKTSSQPTKTLIDLDIKYNLIIIKLYYYYIINMFLGVR